MLTLYHLHKADLSFLLDRWQEDAHLMCPIRSKDNDIRLMPYSPKKEFVLDYINTPTTPLDTLNGYQDTLFTWEGNERHYSAKPGVESSQPLILFGIRPCDSSALAYLDEFYLGEYKDINYSRRRENCTTVVINCLKPGDLCFCPSTGSGPFANEGFDLAFTPYGTDDAECIQGFWVECASEKGHALIELGKDWLRPAAENEVLQCKEKLEKACLDKFGPVPDLSSIRTAMLQGFDHPLWETITPRCIRCSGCTAVCPTCTCFQFNEERFDACSGRRVRVKDSCQTESFTRNAGWHNPRDKKSAVRYRLMDKLVYIRERFGKNGCVGCGRCIDVCPAGIDIREVASIMVRDCPPEGERKTITSPIPERLPAVQEDGVFTPHPARILSIHDEAPGIRRYIVRYTDESLAASFTLTGQFFMITVFGVGEAALSIPFGDQHGGTFEFCVKKVGKVTSALAELQVGDIIGIRGPYGKGFPYESFSGRDVLIVGSGVGLAPVRCIILRLLENRQNFGRIAIIASATSYEGLPYKKDLIQWADASGVSVRYALAKPTDKVAAHVGYINDLLPDLGFDWSQAKAVLCASPRRIKMVSKDLMALGMHGRDIYTSLETHMRCGVGKCGHCKVGSHYMCLDGPVFTYEEMLQLPEEF